MMILTINPVTVEDVTTDLAVLSMSIGESSIAMTLTPAIDVDGELVKIEGASPIPIVGMAGDTDVAAMLETLGAAVQEFVTARGA